MSVEEHWEHHMAEMEANRELVCEYAGHDWQDAGGGLQICSECLAEQWLGGSEADG